MVIVLKSYEKHSFYRFFSIFISVTLLLFLALSSLYYFKEKNRYFQEKKLQEKIIFAECKNLSKLLGEDSKCKMKSINIDDKLSIIYKEILLSLIFSLLFIIPFAYLIAKLALKPVRQSVETMDNFINGIVHDINTPLSVIRINAQSIKNKLQEDYFISKSTRILQGVDYIEALEEQLLFMLKIHQYSPQKINFDIHEMLINRQNYYKDLRKSIEIFVDGDKSIVNGDKYALTRMIDNIVINAIKYSPAKSKVVISIKNDLLIISDNGNGIKNPKEIFNKYYREETNIKGLGLGLYVVKEIANMHSIKINVESKLGVGTTFSFNLSHLSTL